MEHNKDILEQAVKALLQADAAQGPSDELVRQTLEQVEQTQRTNPFVERIFKMKPLSKFAAAAIVLIGISLFFLFNTSSSSIALADVYAKVQQVNAFMYKMTMTMSGMGAMMGLPDTGTTKSEGEVLISTEYGMRMKNRLETALPNGGKQVITQLAYMLPNDKIIVSIMPEQKTFQKIELTGELLEQTKEQNHDPRETIRRMMDCQYVSLGQSEINGVKVQGFETTDPAYSGGVGEVRAVLWVDVETWLPVQSEVSGTMGGKMQVEAVVSDFQWDVAADAADFAYEIPADYKDQGQMKMPEMTEEAAIKGLDSFAKVFGEYPEKIDLAGLTRWLTMSMPGRLIKSEVTEAFKERLEAAKAGGGTALMDFTQEFVAPINSAALFHMKLVQEKRDPMYYGDRVGPADTDAVLLRWKLDSGKYKVIFGDLSSVEMEYADMVKIEPAAEGQEQPAP